MKLWYYLVIAGAVIVVGLIGGFIGYNLRGTGTVQVYSDTTIVHEFIHDTTAICDTVVLKHTDTLIITEQTPIGEIPIRTAAHGDSIPVRMGKETMYIPYNLSIIYRGLVYKYYLTTKPRPYALTLPKPKEKWVAPYAAAVGRRSIGGEYDWWVESGTIVKDRVAVFGMYDGDWWLCVRATLK